MKLLLATTITLMSFAFANAQAYKFLGEYTEDGTPKYFAGKDDVPESVLDKVADALPEGFPVPDYNPQYITAGYDTDVILDKAADVWVTFIGEGAGYKNVLGFYTYDIENPPTKKPNPEDITIVFPNVSKKWSGGSLEVGHKVKIGRFDAGTGIGWVLLANGWKGKVTSGLWQLFSNTAFNPESQESLRHHNVLLNDPDNKCIILGFEDIRRDYSSCDNDFNDALFYITANPFEAMRTTNYNKITEHAAVSSGNDGGLESNGDLARLIAKRNFDRNKAQTFKNKISLQRKYNKLQYKSMGLKSESLENYFPTTGMFGNESPYISSPDDLLSITNAEKVFAIDYYSNGERVSAALGMQTKGEVYNHTKTICDRLNDSKLQDVRMVTLQGYALIYSELIRANGNTEYALVFSVKEDGNYRTLYSRWNLDEYPKGDYLNFQIWGNSMGQVSSIANTILTTLNKEKELKINTAKNVLPTVFIKNGYYRNGKLHLTIVNKENAHWMLLDANYKVTEHEELVNLNQLIDLTGSWEEKIQIETGFLFDMGLSILAENSFQYDAMYVADGPWGADMNTAVDTIANFKVTPHTTINTDGYTIERSVVAKGEVKETINVFRNVLAGDLKLFVDAYKYVHFTIKNDRPIELSLVTNATTEWNQRLRYSVPINERATEYTIAFKEFKNHEGNALDFTQLRTLVFSVQGDYQNYTSFELDINDLVLTETGSRQVTEEEITINFADDLQVIAVDEKIEELQLVNYPNPFTTYTIITLPEIIETAYISITNLSGQLVYQEKLNTENGKNQVRLELSNLPDGLYIYRLAILQSGTIYTGKLVKE